MAGLDDHQILDQALVRELNGRRLRCQALERADLFVRRNAGCRRARNVDARTDHAVAVVAAGEGGAFGVRRSCGEVPMESQDDRMAHRRTQILVPVPGRAPRRRPSQMMRENSSVTACCSSDEGVRKAARRRAFGGVGTWRGASGLRWSRMSSVPCADSRAKLGPVRADDFGRSGQTEQRRGGETSARTARRVGA